MNETYEQEINLKWLIYRVLRAWRPIVVLAIVVGLVLGVGNFATNYAQINDEEYIAEMKLDYERAHASWLATKENLTISMDNLEAEKNRQQEYNEKSVLMQIDPLRKHIASFELYLKYDWEIKPDLDYQNPDLSNRILRAYATYMTGGDMYNYIIDNLSDDIELRYLREILSVSVDYNNKFIAVEVVHASAEACQEILTLARAGIESRTGDISETIDAHSILLSNQVAYETIDLKLEDSQKANVQYLTDLDMEIQTVNEQLAEWKTEKEPAYEYTMGAVVKNAIKMLLIGGVAGALVAAVVIAVAAMLSGKLLNPEDMKSRFGLRLLGQLPRARVKKPLAFVSRWFAAFGGVTAKPEDYDALAKMLGSNIQSDIAARADAQGWKSIALTGMVSEDSLQQVAAAMGIRSHSLVCASDVLTNADSIGKVTGADCIVLVEAQEKSLLADITREMEAFKAWNKPVVGAVVLNADAVM